MKNQSLRVALTQLLNYQPFFAALLYDKMEIIECEDEIPGAMNTLATDGRRIWVNLKYFDTLTPGQRVAAIMHEVCHGMMEACSRIKYYHSLGHLDDVPFSPQLFNVAQDFIINAMIEQCELPIHENWLRDQAITDGMLTEDVYKKLWEKLPEDQKQAAAGQAPQNSPGDGDGDGDGDGNQPIKFKGIGQSHDDHFAAEGSATDSDTNDWKRAIAGAYRTAKAQGNVPGTLKSWIDTVLEPQVDWKSKLRISFFNKVRGKDRSDWTRINRRAILRNPPIVMPRKSGFGCGSVVIAVDTSGSVSDQELAAAFGEIQGILGDAKPERVALIWCDARIHNIDHFDARNDNLESYIEKRRQNVGGRGGTSFYPPFEWVNDEGFRPETFVYITDGHAQFPSQPSYPVVWVMTTDVEAPFGDNIRLKL